MLLDVSSSVRRVFFCCDEPLVVAVVGPRRLVGTCGARGTISSLRLGWGGGGKEPCSELNQLQ